MLAFDINKKSEVQLLTIRAFIPPPKGSGFSANCFIKRYLDNDITEAICFGGLEPFKQFDELIAFIDKLRNYYHCNDTIIIYTGYYPEEIEPQFSILKQFSNIVLKCGRYIPNRPSKYDEILGITLASDNQYVKLVDFDQIKSS